jgi:mannose-6-phosphate isomerase-like protein (cupin superfamily)
MRILWLSVIASAIALAGLLLWRVPVSHAQAAQSGELKGYLQLSRAEMQSKEKVLLTKLNEIKQAVEPMNDYGNHAAFFVHRGADGAMEIHEKWADLMFVQSGEATLLLGGEIQNPRVESPGEIRGTTSKGGVKKVLRAGDIVEVPAGMPHQWLFEKGGKGITFFTMKIVK